MSRRLIGLVAAALVATAAPAAAHPTVELSPTAPTDLTFSATDNVEYLGRFPEHSGNAGGRLLGDRFYLTDPRGVHVYDVADPAAPELLGSLLLPQGETGVALAQEDPDTNGEILLVDAHDPTDPTALPQLQVVDVSDPAAGMSVLGTVDVADHTWTCVSSRVPADGPASGKSKGKGHAKGRTVTDTCAYAYGRTGHIVDLRDPTEPVVLDQTWRAAVGYGDRSNSPYTHDLTEVRPGLVMSAGSTNILMDTSDPAAPVELTRVAFDPERFTSLGYHSVEWARDGESPIAVFGTEIAPSGPTNLGGSDCEGENSVIETWDASGVIEGIDAYDAGASAEEAFGRRGFTKLDAYDAGGRGIFLDGQDPAHLLYCAHWMEPHPDFDAGGKLAVSYYDRGTRFVDVAADGTMSEIGWIVPAEGYSGSAQWISDDIVYVMDYRRGLEVVRLLPQEATGTYANVVDVIAAGSQIEAAVAHEHGPPLEALALAAGAGLFAVELLRRRRSARAARRQPGGNATA